MFFAFFIIQREPRKKTSACDKGKIILSSIRRVINIHFPDLFDKFKLLTDNRKHKNYSIVELITAGVFMFIFKESSRNAYNNDRREENFQKNFYRYFQLRLPHADSIDEIIRDLPVKELEILKAQLVSGLIEQKIFRKFRFLGKYYLIAVDATGIASFEQRHCEHCLTKTSKNGVVTYFHYVLEAKIVTTNGYAISLASEFIENLPDRDFNKQDCEQKAFIRLAAKLKKYFPRLPICILADGLYPNKTVFEICGKNKWYFIITFKEGNLKSVNQEVELLKATAKKRTVYRADKTTRTTLEYKYLNQIEYNQQEYSWVCCTEIIVNKEDLSKTETQFVYLTNIIQNNETVVSTADNGRLRWKIENEGFNTQKNLGYELEHKYSRVSFPAMQNYYQLLQMAHTINQLVEKTKAVCELILEHSKETIINLWKILIGYLTFSQYDNNLLLDHEKG
jgi:hypothetical protein